MTTAVAERKRILVVDDEECIREFIQSELEHAGYEVIAAADGPEALRLVEQNTGKIGGLDLVLLDIKMPGMNGLDVLAEIKNKFSSELPVILLSAYNTYKQDFDSWAAEDYVLKSSDISGLLKAVKKYIK